ncbi:MAG: hypothetical protein GY938_14975 [Ketobacter sp.]|nr:hypothetical protein [Ketobacter sp.]
MKNSTNQSANQIRKELSPAHLKELSLLRNLDKRHVALATLGSWLVAAVAITLSVALSWWLLPVTALLLTAHMMALNNILHEASHHQRRLKPWQKLLVDWFIAYPMCLSLKGYSEIHAVHHRYTGDRHRDPDYIDVVRYQANKGWLTFWRNLTLDPKRMLGSVFGELGWKNTGTGILQYWLVLGVALALIPSGLNVLAVWFAAKLLAYHPVFTLRELMDHQYLSGNEVLTITRNIQGNALLDALFHPYNDNWHLVHHFLPLVTNRNAEKAHRILRNSKTYRCLEHCDGYVVGQKSLLKRWNFSR